MTLNVVMAVAMRYFTEFGSFPGALRKVVADTLTLSAAEYLLRYSRRLRRTSVLCIGGRMWPASVITSYNITYSLLLSISTTSLIFPWCNVCKFPTTFIIKVLLFRHWI